MVNKIRLKSPRCIEWVVQTPPSPDFLLESENFTLQKRKCHLEFYSGYDHSKSLLYFKVDGKLQSPISVDVRVGSILRSLPIETQYVTSSSQIIWKYTGTKFAGCFLTIEIMLNGNSYLKETNPRTIGGHPVPEETRMLLKKENSSSSRTNIHLEALSRDFSKLLDEDFNYDVKIKCGDKTFQAHRNVLAARSAVFSAMLKSNMVEGKTGTINVEDITASTFQSFLRYLYCGTLPKLDVETAQQFYVTADKYAVKELKKSCSKFLTNNLSEDNACEMVVLADLYHDMGFRKNVISYIVDKNIPQCYKQWNVFCDNYCKLANEILNCFVLKYCPK